MKHCYNCKTLKDLSEFYRNKSKKDGLTDECKVCAKNRGNKFRKNNLEKCKKWYKKYAEEHKDEALLRAKEWYKNNKERKQEYDKQYAKENRDKRRLASKKNRETHPKTKRADTALRRAQRINATPKWVDRKALKQIYENCPDGCHVDHIIPLKGNGVCGLHVPWNLQYLKAEDNLRKSNHYSYGEGK